MLFSAITYAAVAGGLAALSSVAAAPVSDPSIEAAVLETRGGKQTMCCPKGSTKGCYPKGTREYHLNDTYVKTDHDTDMFVSDSRQAIQRWRR